VAFLKNVNFSGYKFASNPCISTRECPKILKICQITKIDMGFQKKNILSRSEKVDFVESYDFLRQCLLKVGNRYFSQKRSFLSLNVFSLTIETLLVK
jgi:hypothetical protein